MPMNDSNLNDNDKSVVKNFRKGKKPHSTDLSFRIMNAIRLIYRKIRNQKSNHLSSIDPIEIDDRCSYKEIDDFLARENLENRCPRKEVVAQVEKYDFVSNLPPCLKGKEGFLGIGHDLEKKIQVKMKHSLSTIFHVDLPLPRCTVIVVSTG